VSKSQNLLFPDIPKLNCYDSAPSDKFWDHFPSNTSGIKVSTPVNVSNLEEILGTFENQMTFDEKNRGKKVIFSLRKGANSYQSSYLPSCFLKNADSAHVHGQVLTDTIVSWVAKDFVCGPYESPPFRDFRVNSLLAIEQPSKIRPVLNISLPKNESFNDNIKKYLLEKVTMATALDFGFTLIDCGKNAIFSKFDAKDAYKNVPAPISDLRLQGFFWLGKYFFEKKQIFGASSAVANYDRLGNVLASAACIDANVNSE
jgi:hypothetical protein